MSIRFNDVTFIYNRKSPFEMVANDNVNLEIKDGSFTCLVGKTGCGKSTLIQQMNGLLTPTLGEVQVDEYIVTSNNKRRTRKIAGLRKKVGVVFQFSENQLFEESVLKDVMFGPKNFGIKDDEAKEIAKKCLSNVGLDESYYEKSPFDLSGGERRKVAIAGILALSPSILVLDEPTAGLDPNASRQMLKILEKMNKEGITIVVVTHNMDLVLRYASDVVVMDEGKVVIHSSPVELFYRDDLDKYSLDVPLIVELTKLLLNKGVKLNKNNIKDISTFTKEYLKVRSKKNE